MTPLFRKTPPPPRELWLIVGLGNPGSRYARSRHNAGYMCLERWAARHHLTEERRKEYAIIVEGAVRLGGRDVRVLLAKARSFMNESGGPVAELVRRYHVPPARLIVAYDDLDLPLGKVRLRERGSAGGHNGMKSIIERLGTQGFPRLRIGIGRPNEPRAGAIGHVLGNFNLEEQPAIDAALDAACDALDCTLGEGLAAAMNRFNG
ncbi:MAG: aminoacyl-tRNA hydrolase [Dehalococcoidia bacterium]|nr:aminoacyl-tRNA hydrolase [Dehalococcoidia bacterium]